MKNPKQLSALLALMMFGAQAGAAVISTVGTDTTTATEWRTTSVDKSFDVQNNNVYGNDGYALFWTRDSTYSGSFIQNSGNPLTFTGSLLSEPSYLTITNNGMNFAGLSSAFVNIDDPTQPPGSPVSDIKPGLAGNSGTRSSNFLNLTFDETTPAAGVRIGIMARQGGLNDRLDSVTFTQTVGGAATASFTSIASGVNPYDIYFFDITGIQAGDVFTLSASKLNIGNNNVLIAGMTVDVIPEPGTLVLVATAFVGLGLSALRRRRS